MSGRLLIANLDAEEQLAGGHRGGLPQSLLAGISAFGTLLRAFAEQGDRLWTPAPVDGARLAAVPGLPQPQLVSGELAQLAAGGPILAWAETSEVAAMRRREETAKDGLHRLPLYRLPWRLPPPSPAAVAQVNDRAFYLRLAEELGCALPGARWIASLNELRRHLAAGGASASPTGGWVVKAPFSAAGRHRLVLPNGNVGSAGERALERLLAAYGRLLFEPWMKRTADFGRCGAVLDDGVRWVGWHRQLVDHRGRFRGIRLGAGELTDGERRQAAEVSYAVASRLATAGYRGPFGIDFWRHRDAAGRQRLQPLGEVNARLTFGFVAHALAERLRDDGGLDATGGNDGTRCSLHLTMQRRPGAQETAAEELWLLRRGRGESEPGEAWWA